MRERGCGRGVIAKEKQQMESDWERVGRRNNER